MFDSLIVLEKKSVFPEKHIKISKNAKISFFIANGNCYSFRDEKLNNIYGIGISLGP